jgi:hypothetical protein
MADLWRDFWTRGTRMGQIHDRYMMIIIIRMIITLHCRPSCSFLNICCYYPTTMARIIKLLWIPQRTHHWGHLNLPPENKYTPLSGSNSSNKCHLVLTTISLYPAGFSHQTRQNVCPNTCRLPSRQVSSNPNLEWRKTIPWHMSKKCSSSM